MNNGQLIFNFGAGNFFACAMWSLYEGQLVQALAFIILFSIFELGLIWATRLPAPEANQRTPDHGK